MEDKGKKGYSKFFRVLFVLFVVFLCVYSISVNGYVENISREKTLYTEEQIAAFERDVLEGKEIDINDYIMPEAIDYSNGISTFGEDVSNLIDYAAKKTMETFNSFFSLLFK